MAEGILGLGSSGAASLNQELIDKLKAAETKALIEPIESDIEDIATEKEVFNLINDQVQALTDAIKPFDLFVSGGITAFDQKAATTSGDSVTFDAADISSLNNGITTVNIDTLAQKDVYQSNTITEAEKDILPDIGVLTISVGSEIYSFDTGELETDGITRKYETYDDLISDIDSKTGVNASLDKVGTDAYRLILKSEESGIDNALSISGAAATSLGLDDVNNHILEAKDMKAFIDGIEYNVSANSLTVDGLSIAATKTGESSINITNDSTEIETALQNFVDQYNALVTLIDEETFNAETTLNDISSIRNVVTQVKDKLFGTYGENADKSIFNYGFELDQYGSLSLDSTVLASAISDDSDGLRELFLGTADNEGLGTQLKASLDEMNFTYGVLFTYESSMTSREENLKDELEKSQETLDNKYSSLATQFGAYSAIITQYESQFSGLQLMIQQSTAG